ncbi:MAG: methyltransferase domain-containing protein [Desulfuromonadales bacterium]
MSQQASTDHQATIVEQFSQQAIPFAQVPGHLDSIQLLIELAEVKQNDNVLDVACGPGLVACEFAAHCGHVTGIDITPAMIEQALKRQQEKGLTNLYWAVGEALPLPYADNSFLLVITRYSFHHFLDPSVALSDMIRVCKPGGRVLVADVAIDPAKSAAYDRLEIMRDSSHTHALTTAEFSALFQQSGLEACRQSAYGVEIELEAQLKASFPKPGDTERLREMITADIGVNEYGINARRANGTIVYTVPIGVFVGEKKARK